MSDWLKPGSVPPNSTAELVDDDIVASDADAETPMRRGEATTASGGYGTPSSGGSSGGSGEATDDTSSPGTDDQSDWLRDAPGGPR